MDESRRQIKKVCAGIPVQCNHALLKLPFHGQQVSGIANALKPGHCVHLVLLVTRQFSMRVGMPNPYACSGREKRACDRALKASADQSDFQSSLLSGQESGGP
jgi:hypothetical protein